MSVACFWLQLLRIFNYKYVSMPIITHHVDVQEEDNKDSPFTVSIHPIAQPMAL